MTSQRGSTPTPAEAQLLAALSHVWQQLTKDLGRNNCIHAVCAIQSALAEWGVDATPVTVTALVQWPGMHIQLGRANPTWRKGGGWSGHLGLWIPRLGRFVDPTIGQANRPQTPTQIESGIVLPIPLEQLGRYTIPKDGAQVQYELVDDPGPSWWTGLPAGGADEIRGNSIYFRERLASYLEEPELLAIRAALTDPVLAAALGLK